MPRQAIKPVPLVAVSPFQASEATGLRQERIAAAIRAGEIHAVRVGVKTKILVSELEKWLASHDPAAHMSA
jgi:excisionase family DNA binding protein